MKNLDTLKDMAARVADEAERVHALAARLERELADELPEDLLAELASLELAARWAAKSALRVAGDAAKICHDARSDRLAPSGDVEATDEGGKAAEAARDAAWARWREAAREYHRAELAALAEDLDDTAWRAAQDAAYAARLIMDAALEAAEAAERAWEEDDYDKWTAGAAHHES